MLITLSAALLVRATRAQVADEPTLTVQRVVLGFLQLNAAEKISTPEGRALLTGEALKIFKTPSIGPLPLVVDKVFVVDGTHAVARVCAKAPTRIVDTYFHLEKTTSWRIAAFRVLAQTGLVEMGLAALSSKQQLTADETREVSNMKLTLESDAGLRTWFPAHRAALDSLVTAAQTRLKTGESAGDDGKVNADLGARLRELALTSVSIADDGNVEVAIGGIADNLVMFIFSPRSSPPAMSPDKYIWVEALDEKWFLARTT